MGTYLSKPIVDKNSQDVENESLLCGVSSMQGWREQQEDAHNCILDFDKNISLFAVYDGHGGAEVAQYAAEHLPSLVKNEFYEKEDYEKALIEAYLKFDDSLIEPEVVDRLTVLREEATEAECDDDVEDEENREELNELYREANMPIEEIILNYKKKILMARENMENDDEPGSSTASPISKPDPAHKDEINVANGINEGNSEQNKADNSEEHNKAGNSEEHNEAGNSDEHNEAGNSSSSDVKTNGTSKDEENEISKDEENETSKDEENETSKDEENETSKDEENETSKDEENGTKESAPEGSEAECGPSSSKGQNGEERSSTMCLISNDSGDDSDDDSDEMYESPENLNDESNSEDSEEDINEDEDDSTLLDEDEDKAGKDSGCTAVMALLVNNKLYVANAGDSRCVVSIDGKAHDMSKDHKPEDELEFQRITAAGGRVSNDGRVNGGLNLSRALGDHNYKKNDDLPNTKQMITALPDVSVLDVKPENNNFLVLACDGIWNSLNSQEVVDFISERINEPDVKLSSICEELFDTCLAPDTLSDGTGCDNMTCIIVKLKQNHKRSHTEDEDESVNDIERKKLKLDLAETESVQ